jgi:hypothetical protein
MIWSGHENESVVFNCIQTDRMSRTKEDVNPISDQNNCEVHSRKDSRML